MRLLSDPRDFIPSSVALLGVQSESRRDTPSHRFPNEGQRMRLEERFVFLVLSDPCGFFSG